MIVQHFIKPIYDILKIQIFQKFPTEENIQSNQPYRKLHFSFYKTHHQMRRKQYRQRNKEMFRQPLEPQESAFISYSSHLRKKEQQQMRVLEKIDYICEMPVKKNDNEMFLFMKQKGREESRVEGKDVRGGVKVMGDGRVETIRDAKQKRHLTNDLNVTQHLTPKTTQNYQKIDTSAVVIKGRLIYLKQQTTQTLSNDHYLHLLRQNNISLKQFLTQDQDQIKDQIKKNQSVKQNQIIKDYILRNMSEQSNGEVMVMERFHEVKGALFD